MSDHEDAPIRITAYEPAWIHLFERERDLLSSTLAVWLTGPIEHIGSTAVPGLAAKPVIDIMAAVESLDAAKDAIPVLRRVDYLYAPYRSEVMHWFCKPGISLRTHHLHLVPFGSRLWIERLAFRDSLRSNQTIANQYLQLKVNLAAAHEMDREAYTDGKTAFILSVLKPLIGTS